MRDTVKIISIYAVSIGLVVASLYWSIEISSWFYLLAAPAVAFLTMLIYVHSGADEFVRKLKRKRRDKRDAENEEKRVKALNAFLEQVYLRDGEHHHFLNLIHQSLKDKGLISERSWKWTAETELVDSLHLNALNLEWFEELESVMYNCAGGVFHGQCVQFFSWGKAVLNFSEGKLEGRQEVICDERLVLKMTFKGGTLRHVEDVGLSGMRINTRAIGDVFRYSLETANESINFETLDARPEFSSRRLSDKIESLEFWRYGTPIGEIKISNRQTSECVTIELEHDSARILNLNGKASGMMLEKQFWSQLAFLQYDFRFVVGRCKKIQLVYSTGIKGPPGLGRGDKDYPRPLRSSDQLFV